MQSEGEQVSKEQAEAAAWLDMMEGDVATRNGANSRWENILWVGQRYKPCIELVKHGWTKRWGPALFHLVPVVRETRMAICIL